MNKLRFLLIALLLLVVGLVACGGEELPEVVETAAPTIPAATPDIVGTAEAVQQSSITATVIAQRQEKEELAYQQAVELAEPYCSSITDGVCQLMADAPECVEFEETQQEIASVVKRYLFCDNEGGFGFSFVTIEYLDVSGHNYRNSASVSVEH